MLTTRVVKVEQEAGQLSINSTGVRDRRFGVSVALIIPQRPDPPNILTRTAIRSLQSSVRCPTRLCTGPAAFPVVRR